MDKGIAIFTDGHEEEILNYEKLTGVISFKCESGIYKYVDEDIPTSHEYAFYKWRPGIGHGEWLRTLEIDHIRIFKSIGCPNSSRCYATEDKPYFEPMGE